MGNSSVTFLPWLLAVVCLVTTPVLAGDGDGGPATKPALAGGGGDHGLATKPGLAGGGGDRGPTTKPVLAAGGNGGPTTKPAPPSAQALKQAQNTVHGIFQDDFAKARKPEERDALAKRLLQAGIDERKDQAGRFTLLVLARDMAAETGDAATAFQAVDEADKGFRVDALALKAAAAATTAKALRTPEDRQRFAAAADGVAAQALVADRYDVARQVADLALSAARSGGGGPDCRASVEVRRHLGHEGDGRRSPEGAHIEPDTVGFHIK